MPCQCSYLKICFTCHKKVNYLSYVIHQPFNAVYSHVFTDKSNQKPPFHQEPQGLSSSVWNPPSLTCQRLFGHVFRNPMSEITESLPCSSQAPAGSDACKIKTNGVWLSRLPNQTEITADDRGNSRSPSRWRSWYLHTEGRGLWTEVWYVTRKATLGQPAH